MARVLEVIGDWWTLLVVREAMLGSRRFADFAAELPIARNVLTRRLNHLVRRGVLARVDAGMHGPPSPNSNIPRCSRFPGFISCHLTEIANVVDRLAVVGTKFRDAALK